MPTRNEHFAVTDLLGKPPGWLARSGITIVFVVVLLGLALAAFIHYPDKLTAPVILNNDNPPISLAAPLSTVLDTLFITEGDTVSAGTVLAALEGPVDWREAMLLELAVQSFTQEEETDRDKPSFQLLGNLQAGYARWMESRQAWDHYLQTNQMSQQLANLEQEQTLGKELVMINRKQVQLLEQQLDLENRRLDRQKALAADGVISPQDLEDKEKERLAMQQSLESMQANLVQQQVRIASLEQRQLALQLAHQEERFTRQQEVQKATEELTGQLRAWREQYLVIAPLTGQVLFQPDLIEKQRVAAGEPLLSLIPQERSQGKLIARMQMSTRGLGKVSVGNTVLIHLDAYPSKEFGTLAATITQMAVLPQISPEGNAFFRFTAEIPLPIVTTYGHELPPSEYLNGTAFIITEDRSVLARIFEQLRNLTQVK